MELKLILHRTGNQADRHVMDWLVLRYDGRGTQWSPGGHSGSLPQSRQVLHRLGGSNGMGTFDLFGERAR